MIKRKYLILILFAAFLTGCQDQAEIDMKKEIKFEPNEEYVGDPNPDTEQKMKLTEDEQKEFEQLQQELHSEIEGE